MKGLLASAVLISLIAVINCRTPRCLINYITDNIDVALRIGENCGHLLDDSFEEIQRFVCNNMQSACFQSLDPAYRACGINVEQGCRAGGVSSGSIQVHAVPILILILALFSVLF